MQGDWETVRGFRNSQLAEVGFGAIRAALLFGSTAVALALIVTPLLDRGTRSQDAVVSLAESVDPIVTGSADPGVTPSPTRGGAGGLYTIHRSVLQSSPEAVCIIRANGSHIGDC